MLKYFFFFLRVTSQTSTPKKGTLNQLKILRWIHCDIVWELTTNSRVEHCVGNSHYIVVGFFFFGNFFFFFAMNQENRITIRRKDEASVNHMFVFCLFILFRMFDFVYYAAHLSIGIEQIQYSNILIVICAEPKPKSNQRAAIFRRIGFIDIYVYIFIFHFVLFQLTFPSRGRMKKTRE